MPDPLVLEVIVDAAADAEAIAQVRGWFVEQGFDVGPEGPASMTVSAPFDVAAERLGIAPQKRQRLAEPPPAGAPEIAVGRHALPASVRRAVATIVRPKAPDFGPWNP